jgi:hypothetical protein
MWAMTVNKPCSPPGTNGRFAAPRAQWLLFVASLVLVLLGRVAPVRSQTTNYEFNDSHFHLTNNIQEGPAIHDFLNMMGNKAGRVALFGVPLQQQWSYRVDGDRAPTCYLHSDAPLYYYSFTDAWIAMAYKSLPKEQQARFDPMITGFNPTDMYAADHIRRVLETFSGVFTGIGEFTIHKEFVSAKIPGEVACLQNPALDRIFDFAAEVGLVANRVKYATAEYRPRKATECLQPEPHARKAKRWNSA